MSIALQSDLRFLFLFLTYHIKKTHTHKSCFFIRGNWAASHYSAVLVQSVPQGGSVKLGVVWWTWLKKKLTQLTSFISVSLKVPPAYLSAKIKNWVPFLQLKYHDLDQLTFKNKEIKSRLRTEVLYQQILLASLKFSFVFNSHDFILEW